MGADGFVEPERKSRTRRKKEDRALQALGERLTALSPEQLERVALPDVLREAVLLARRIRSHGARRRQMQTIGAVMRKIDAEPVRRALERLGREDSGQTAVFRKIERWRDGLLAGDRELLGEILETCPDADARHIERLVEEARRAAGSKTGRKSARLLFRYLRQIGPQ